ncbi:MAG: Fe-S protein assembly co-chaperone HscB [Pseudomonadota bacterium]
MSEQHNAFQRSFFDLFSLPQIFRIDNAALARAYREAQAQVHPDRYVHAPEAERRAAMQWASHVNEAYQTLKQPLSRARYLLQLQNVAIANTLPPQFLMRQMEWREAVEQAEAAYDAAELARLADAVHRDLEQGYAELAHDLDDEHNWTAAAQCVARLMFMDKLGAEIGDALETLDV